MLIAAGAAAGGIPAGADIAGVGVAAGMKGFAMGVALLCWNIFWPCERLLLNPASWGGRPVIPVAGGAAAASG